MLRKTLTIQFQTFRSFAVAFGFGHCHFLVFCDCDRLNRHEGIVFEHVLKSIVFSKLDGIQLA